MYGVVALILGIVGAFAYIRDAYSGKTKPHRFAWFIFLIISLISFASQLALGAKASLIYAGWFVCNNIIVLSLSLRKNKGYGGMTSSNLFALGLALVAIVLWVTLSSPLAALISVLVAEIIGVVMIVVKSYKFPHSETVAMWFLGGVASALNILAVGKLDFALLLFPVYLLIANIVIVSTTLIRRYILATKKQIQN